MSLNIENRVATAWQTLLEANTYITNNSIPVKQYRDGESKIDNERLVVVQVEAAANLFDNRVSPLWLCTAVIQPATYLLSDKKQVNLDLLYQECFGLIASVTLSELSTAGAITFNGITNKEAGVQEYEDSGRYQMYSINVECYVQQ